jgi:uncharacterized protein YjbI with pentapeptide repeats
VKCFYTFCLSHYTTVINSFAIGNPSGLKPYEVKADQPWGQTFQIGSGGGTATVNTIALGLYREPDAASQTITVSVRSSWNGSVLWQRAIPSSQLGQAADGTATLSGITGLALQQGQSYVLRLSSSTTDGKVYITASDGIGPYAQGAMLEKEGFAQEGDLRFSISGTLSAPTTTTPTPPPTPPAPDPGELASAVVTSATREALQAASTGSDSFIAVNLNFDGQDLSDLDLADGYIRNVSFRGADLSNSKWADINNFIPQNLPVPEQQQPGFELTTYLANTNWNLDFRGANLFAADFSDAYLSGSNFSSLPGQITRLEKVKFDDSYLANASFRGVSAAEISFQRADLRKADFTGADLRKALFQGADLTLAILANALLGGSNVTEGILIGTNLTNAVIGASDFGKADFTGVNLQGANLQGASLLEVSFKAANVAGANFTGADMGKTDFTGANLRGAILRGAKLLEATFKDADLTGADLTGADLSKANFTGAILGSGSGRAILTGTVQVDTIGLGVDPGGPTITPGQARFAIDGDPAVGELLEANQLSPDPDGDGSFSYLWQRSADGVQWITVGTEETYEVADADAGQGLRLVVTYLDGANNSETVITAPVVPPSIPPVEPPVEPPTGPATFDPGLVGTGDVAGFTAGADLRFQLIEKVEVIGANASGILLTGATIKDSFFYNVDFSKASLRGVILNGFNKSAPLGAPEASLFSTFRLNFRGADLSFLQAKGTNFSGADFRNHADGTATNLRAAQLPESNLSNANFTGVTAGGINLAYVFRGRDVPRGTAFLTAHR